MSQNQHSKLVNSEQSSHPQQQAATSKKRSSLVLTVVPTITESGTPGIFVGFPSTDRNHRHIIEVHSLPSPDSEESPESAVDLGTKDEPVGPPAEPNNPQEVSEESRVHEPDQKSDTPNEESEESGESEEELAAELEEELAILEEESEEESNDKQDTSSLVWGSAGLRMRQEAQGVLQPATSAPGPLTQDPEGAQRSIEAAQRRSLAAARIAFQQHQQNTEQLRLAAVQGNIETAMRQLRHRASLLNDIIESHLPPPEQRDAEQQIKGQKLQNQLDVTHRQSAQMCLLHAQVRQRYLRTLKPWQRARVLPY
ncbi:hypothetical protein ABW21_db0206386 [Orbilia brochopaga]|nr:hypothetical protein ABW21_db0206386 [Drechslerella brochopaga]